MKTIIVDFKGVKTVWEFHEALIEPFGLEKPERSGMYPGYKYAKNYYALLDILYPMIRKTKIVIRNIDNLSKELEYEVPLFKKIMSDLEKEDKNVTIVYE